MRRRIFIEWDLVRYFHTSQAIHPALESHPQKESDSADDSVTIDDGSRGLAC